MATWREWLDQLGFNWEEGQIVYQPVKGDTPGWSYAEEGQLIPPDHPVLDRTFDCGYGGPKAPRIIAEDDRAFYFVSQYDGSTQPEKLYKALVTYAGADPEPTPYPGG